MFGFTMQRATRRTNVAVMLLAISSLLINVSQALADAPLKLAKFSIDATPPVGSPLAYDPMKLEGGKLSCRGVVLLPANQKPIVLVAIDWIGVGNGGHTQFCQAIADAAKTDANRVAFHALHQHDAPRCDFSAEALLAEHGLPGEMFDVKFTRDVMKRLNKAIGEAIANASPITHMAHGEAAVKDVASNRRILGDDGKVRFTRWTATRDATVRAMPTGTIDPNLKLIAFWNGNQPVAALTYYACHPQSYYRTGSPSTDFPGIARNMRDKALASVLHVHFNGAGGNIGAGKWNDGAKENRAILAKRVEAGMTAAWKASLKQRTKVDADNIGWGVESVALPPSTFSSADDLAKNVANPKTPRTVRIRSAVHLAFLRRCESGHRVPIGCLKLGDVRVLHMPGELFVEYQLAAQKMKPNLFVAMAAYGDYGPGYIGTAIAYKQGGYETSPLASRVAPEVESVLLDAVRKLLD